MRIISADSVSKKDNLSDLLEHIGDGIVLLGERGYDYTPDSELRKVIEITRPYPISLISTQEDEEENSVAYIIRNGQMIPAQKRVDSHSDARHDLLYGVSPTNVPVKGLKCISNVASWFNL